MCVFHWANLSSLAYTCVFSWWSLCKISGRIKWMFVLVLLWWELCMKSWSDIRHNHLKMASKVSSRVLYKFPKSQHGLSTWSLIANIREEREYLTWHALWPLHIVILHCYFNIAYRWISIHVIWCDPDQYASSDHKVQVKMLESDNYCSFSIRAPSSYMVLSIHHLCNSKNSLSQDLILPITYL